VIYNAGRAVRAIAATQGNQATVGEQQREAVLRPLLRMLPPGCREDETTKKLTLEQLLYLKAIDLDEKFAGAYLALGYTVSSKGTIRLLNGRTMTEQQLYLKAVDLNPVSSYAICNLGTTVPVNGAVKLLNGEVLTKQQLFLRAIDLNSSSLEYSRQSSSLSRNGTIILPNGRMTAHQWLKLKAENLDKISDGAFFYNLAITLPELGCIKLLNGKVMSKFQLLTKAVQLQPHNKIFVARLSAESETWKLQISRTSVIAAVCVSNVFASIDRFTVESQTSFGVTTHEVNNAGSESIFIPSSFVYRIKDKH
jgi:hypothetical protein